VSDLEVHPLVLVVEDDPNVRSLIETLLSSEGYVVQTASDGLAGLVALRERRPALVLLDMMMPDLGGLQVLETLRGDEGLAGVPVIVITGRQESIPELRRALGPGNVFLKPFAVAELLAQVARVTGGP
jgi:CheY-like chemotaxis protein